jgi:hypothetical protein
MKRVTRARVHPWKGAFSLFPFYYYYSASSNSIALGLKLFEFLFIGGVRKKT